MIDMLHNGWFKKLLANQEALIAMEVTNK